MALETRQAPNGMIVQRFDIPRSDIMEFDVWEPYAGHSTTQTIEGKRLGKVGTRDVPAEIDSLPAHSDERFNAVTNHYKDQEAEATAAVIAVFPEAATARRCGNSLVMKVAPV